MTNVTPQQNNGNEKGARSARPSTWQETTLGEVVDILDGDRGKNYPNGDDFLKSGYCLFLNTKNVPNEKFSFLDVSFISKDKDGFLGKGKLERDDFVLTTRGTLGNFALFSQKVPFENIRINSGMVILRSKNLIHTNFLNFYLSSSFFKYQIASLQSGSAQPQLPIRDLKTFEILLPPLPEQRAIAAVLSSFDDKIELLREQNQTLEQTAQTIFKEWFGKYKVGDDLPDGWRVGKIGDFGEIICGKTPSKNNQDYFGGNIPFIKIPDMHNQIFIEITEDSLSSLGANSQKNKYIPRDSISVSCIATVGLVSIANQDSQTNQQINSIVLEQKTYREYLYLVLSRMKKELEAIGSGGSATLNINTGVFSSIPLIKPSDGVLEKFSEIVESMFEKIRENSQQIQTLTKNRDTLLPKLMKGDIRVM